MTPVLVYKYLSAESQNPEQPFTRPLFATDWSQASRRAVEYLKNLKNIVEEVHVIHVADEKSLKGDSAMMVQKTRKKARQKLEDICDILEAEGIRAKPHVYIGNTAAEIEKAARECQATMIIAGTSGKESWKERWIGGTPKILADKSIFPTLLIPPE